MAQILYGAGHNLRFHYKDWKDRGIEAVCVVDMSEEKQYTQFNHSNDRLDILPFDEANRRYPDSQYYITLTTPKCYKVKEWLISHGIKEQNINILEEMFVEYPDEDNSDMPFKPDELVKSCDYIERGISFLFDGLYCCCLSSGRSGILIDADTLNSYGDISVDFLNELIVKERKKYFMSLNGKDSRQLGHCNDCVFLCEKPFREVSFSMLGGKSGLQVVNDQCTLVCNHRCVYCGTVAMNQHYACQYDNQIVMKTIDGFASKKKPSYFYAAINSGETTLRKDLDELLDYFREHELENVYIFSNGSIYSNGVERGLKNGNIMLITSIDAGTPETYKKVHCADDYNKVISNLIEYSVRGDRNQIRIKYIVLDDQSNTSDADLLGFLYAAKLINPEDINILPQFRSITDTIPQSTIDFAAKMFFLCPLITNKVLYFFPALGIGGDTEEFPEKVRATVNAFDDQMKKQLTELAVKFLQDKSK